jgi:hypothetical protein
MNMELHKATNHVKQVSYAAYLLKLNASSRLGLLEAMKPELREKMQALMNHQKAIDIANMEPQVRAMYLSNLKRTNYVRYEEMLPKIVSYIWKPTSDIKDKCRHTPVELN